ncbi:MAG: DUF11 domain-containing protein [Candidatus Eisenbacteria bacterium]|nr:DUF11 domain-containing protein [Candidatus Eisenbacteria bacterium]
MFRLVLCLGILACLLGCVLLLIPGASWAIDPAVRNILISDRTADPLGYGDARGGVFLLRYQSGQPTRVAAFPAGPVDPTAVLSLPDRSFLVADSGADPFGLGQGGGALWRIDPRGELTAVTAELVVASPSFVDPIDILIEPEGTYLVLDSNADPFETNRLPGAVFRVDPRTRDVDLLAASPDFVQPRSMAWDTDGSVLIVDQAADPLRLGTPYGALFRLNRITGVVSVAYVFSRPRFPGPAAVVALPNGDYLIADRDADPSNRGTPKGAIFRLPRGGTPVVFSADPLFEEPVDLMLGVEGDLWVMDAAANPDLYPTSRGAVFRYDLETGRRRQTISSSLFKAVSGMGQVTGAEFDSSRVTWTDDNASVLRPGDVFTVRAQLRNTGTDDAAGVVLADTLAGDWIFLAGTDSVSQGALSYDPERRLVRWVGDVAQGESATVRFQLRLWDGVAVDREIRQELRIVASGATNTFSYRGTPRREFEEGTIVYCDYLSIGGREVGALYTVDPDSTAPQIFWSGAPLVRPLDLVQLEDDRIAILDTRAFETSAAGPEAVFLFSPATGDFDTLLTRLEGDGLKSLQGIASDRNGDLLLIDKDANPNGCGTGAVGAIYHLDVDTGGLTLVLSDCNMKEPLDATVDRNGKIYITDVGVSGPFGPNEPGQFFEYNPTTRVVYRFPQNDRWFVDPTGIYSRDPGRFYVAEQTGNPRNLSGNSGALFQITRNPLDFRLVVQDERFVDPDDVYAAPDGTIYLCDREADPLELDLNDPGALFKIDPVTSAVEVAAAGAVVHRPDGLIGYYHADLLASRLNILLPSGSSRAEPGDTLTLRLLVTNPTDRSAPQAMARFTAYPSLELLSGTAEIGSVTVSGDVGEAIWSSRIPAYDSVLVNVRARVKDLASFGSRAGAEVLVMGGGAPLTIEQSILVRASFTPGELIMADEAADPQNPPARRGALFRLGGQGDPAEYLPLTSTSIKEPTCVDWDSDGRLVIGAKRGADSGSIYRVNTQTNALEALINADPNLKTPTDLLYLSNGDLLVVDADAEGATIPGKGALWRLPSGGTALELFSADARFRSPQQVAIDGRGRMWVCDREANPDQLPLPNTGALFQISPTSGSVINYYQSTDLPEPTGIQPYRVGSLLITDQVSNPNNYPQTTGTLWEFNPDSRLLSIALSTQVLKSPRRSFVLPNGNILIADRGQRRPDAVSGQGAILVLDRTAGSLRFHTYCDSFVGLSDFAYLPSSYLQFVDYTVTDPNGPPVYPSDRVKVRAELKNFGVATAEEVVFADSLPAGTVLDITSLTADGGEVSGTDRVARWTGSLAPGETVMIQYDVQLNPFETEGKILAFTPAATERVVGTIRDEVRLPVLVPLESGYAYVADGDADPYALGGSPGAILKVDLITGSTRAFYSSTQLKQPRDVALVGRQNTSILILDNQARPGAGAGALLALDPITQQLHTVATDSTWINLQQILVESDDSVLLLDSSADPFDLRDGIGPGAIYRVDLDTGATEVAYSDTTLRLPTSMAFLPDGRLVVADAEMDPGNFGNRNGALFAIDLSTRETTVFATSPQFETPISITPRPEGGFYLADQSASPFGGSGRAGAVFSIGADGVAALLSDSKFFRRLSTIGLRADGHPIMTDFDADPFGLGQAYGAIHAWNSSVIGRFSPLASSTMMRRPAGFFVFNDLVPVDLSLTAEPAAEGVALRWEVPLDAPGVRVLVFRRALSDPDEALGEVPDGFALIASGPALDGVGSHEYVDRDVEPGRWYAYALALAGDDGSVEYTLPTLVQAPTTALRLTLYPPSPRPFRDLCTLRFALPRAGSVRVELFDVGGRRVRALARGSYAAGVHALSWDGRDDEGRRLGSGVYFARLSAPGGERNARLVMIH